MLYMLISLSMMALVFLSVLWFVDRERRKKRFSPFTEAMLRSPGYTLSKQHEELSDSMLTWLLMILIPPIISVLVMRDLGSTGKLIVGIFMLMIVLWGIFNLKKLFDQAQKIRLGLHGEIYTGQELNYLMRKGAWVYHDIPYKYGNIDHIVISAYGVFTVETKAVKKPMNDKGGRLAKVQVIDNTLVFPHWTTSEPIEQAKRHADYLQKALQRKLGEEIKVYPIISLPGWFVENENKKKGFRVINPKRGEQLATYFNKIRISEDKLPRVVSTIEELARSVKSHSDITDPDANKKYGFFLNKKYEEPRL